MKTEQMMDIMSGLSEEQLDRHHDMKMKLKRKKKKRRYATVIGAVACLMLVFVAMPWYIMIGEVAYGNENMVDIKYNQISDAEMVMNYKTLYTNLNLDKPVIYVTYRGKDGVADYSQPKSLKVSIDTSEGKLIEHVTLYTFFGKSSLDGLVSEYTENVEEKKVFGYDIRFSKRQNKGSYYVQARFLYDGNLYIIDVANMNPDKPVSKILDSYLEKILSTYN